MNQASAESHRVLRLLALLAVSAGVVVLAAAAFVLSYHGVHEVALATGASKMLARIYPPMFDAILVIAGAAVLSLRGAGWAVRSFAWLSLLVVLAAVAGVDTLHAVGTHLPHRTAVITAAIVPWALALLGFVLLLAMLRNARLRRTARPRRGRQAPEPEARSEADTVPGTPVGDFLAGPAAADGPGPDPSRPDTVLPGGSTLPAAELASTGYPGDRLVAGRPAAEEPAAEEPAADWDNVAREAASQETGGQEDADDPAPTVPAQALPSLAEPPEAVNVPAGPGPGGVSAGTAPDSGPAGGPAPSAPAAGSPEASGSAQAGEATAGIPMRWPGWSSADQAETAESSLDSEPGQDDPVSDEAYPATRPGVLWVPRAREEPPSEVIRDEPDPAAQARHDAPPDTPAAAGPDSPAIDPAASGSGASDPAASGHPATESPAAEPATSDPGTGGLETSGQSAEPEPGTSAPAGRGSVFADPAVPRHSDTEPAGITPSFAAPAEARQPGSAPAEAGSGTFAPGESSPAEGSLAGPAFTGADVPGMTVADQPGGQPAPSASPDSPAASTDQATGSHAPADPPRPAAPVVTSFWDSVFSPRTSSGAGQPATEPVTPPAPGPEGQPPGSAPVSPEGQPGQAAAGETVAGETEAGETEDEAQFDRFRSSPTPPDE